MKTGTKRCMAVILAAVMSIVCFLPVTVSAAPKKTTYWLCNKKAACKMEAEAGQIITMNLLMKPYDAGACIYLNPEGTWKSSNRKVASVSGKEGLVRTKKPGKTKITLKFGKKTYTCTLTVKKKGSIIKGDLKKLMQADQALKPYAKKVSKANFIKASEAYENYEKCLNKVQNKLDAGVGTLQKKKARIAYQVQYAEKANSNLYAVSDKILKQSFPVKSMKAVSASKLSVTLTKPVTDLQMHALKFLKEDKSCSLNGLSFGKMVATDWFEDGEPSSEESESLNLYGTCRFVKGSTKVTITRDSDCEDSFKDATYVNVDEYSYFRLTNGDDQYDF